MRVYGVRIFVDDLVAAHRFYAETLELPVAWEMVDQGVAGFDAGGVTLIVEHQEPDDNEGRALVGRFVGLSLAVDDIDATWRQLVARGVTFTSPPKEQFWGGVLAHFRDPAGNVLTLLGSTS